MHKIHPEKQDQKKESEKDEEAHLKKNAAENKKHESETIDEVKTNQKEKTSNDVTDTAQQSKKEQVILQLVRIIETFFD